MSFAANNLTGLAAIVVVGDQSTVKPVAGEQPAIAVRFQDLLQTHAEGNSSEYFVRVSSAGQTGLDAESDGQLPQPVGSNTKSRTSIRPAAPSEVLPSQPAGSSWQATLQDDTTIHNANAIIATRSELSLPPIQHEQVRVEAESQPVLSFDGPRRLPSAATQSVADHRFHAVAADRFHAMDQKYSIEIVTANEPGLNAQIDFQFATESAKFPKRLPHQTAGDVSVVPSAGTIDPPENPQGASVGPIDSLEPDEVESLVRDLPNSVVPSTPNHLFKISAKSSFDQSTGADEFTGDGITAASHLTTASQTQSRELTSSDNTQIATQLQSASVPEDASRAALSNLDDPATSEADARTVDDSTKTESATVHSTPAFPTVDPSATGTTPTASSETSRRNSSAIEIPRNQKDSVPTSNADGTSPPATVTVGPPRKDHLAAYRWKIIESSPSRGSETFGPQPAAASSDHLRLTESAPSIESGQANSLVDQSSTTTLTHHAKESESLFALPQAASADSKTRKSSPEPDNTLPIRSDATSNLLPEPSLVRADDTIVEADSSRKLLEAIPGELARQDVGDSISSIREPIQSEWNHATEASMGQSADAAHFTPQQSAAQSPAMVTRFENHSQAIVENLEVVSTAYVLPTTESSGDSASVINQLDDALLTEIASARHTGEARQLTIELHPAELGQLTVNVDWDNELVKAQIIASEFSTSELLNRDKSILIEAIRESGFDLESFDVSHGDSQSGANSQRSRADIRTLEPQLPNRLRSDRPAGSAGIGSEGKANSTGVNLIA